MQTIIRSTVANIPTSTKGNCFITRKITNFNHDLDRESYTPIILEQLFQEKEVFVKDAEGNKTDKKIFERIIINNNFRNFTSTKISESEVTGLFQFLKKDILKTDNYSLKNREMLVNILLFDTNGLIKSKKPMYSLKANEWVIDTNNYIIVDKFSE